MRKIQVILLALVAVFALSVVAASSAFAATEAALWLVSGAEVPAAGVPTNLEVVSTKKLVLEDMEAGPLKQATSVECGGTGTGNVLPEGLDEQLTATPEGCVRKTDGACETLESVAAVNLPWKTEVLQVTGSSPELFEDALVSGTGGNPGWLVECETLLGKKNDVCTTNAGKTPLVNESSGEVLGTFETRSGEEASCTEGTSKSGLVSGQVLAHALVSGVLETLAASLP